MLNGPEAPSRTEGPGPGPESLAVARRIHHACERFEADWRARKHPRVEEFLVEPGDPARPRLLEELAGLEIELRAASGERPTVAEYLARFPADPEVVARLFGSPPAVGGFAPTEVWPPPTQEGGPVGEHRPSSPSSSAPPAQGQRLGKYELIAELARGGMGVVYKARDTVLNRVVAIKMILSGAMATESERERFRREAALAAKLDHPNVVPIYEVGELDGFLYFTMRLVEGGSLASRMDRYRDDPMAAAGLIETLARAVQYANEQGFIHCDLKPSNILIDRDGVPQITDFGLARQASRDDSITASGAVLGTPSYMAPEQASGERDAIGPATDVHGLGAILYELLAGRPPFRMATTMETVMQAIYCDPLPPRELRPQVPRELEHICLKCLEKAPRDRYATADDLSAELARFLQGDAIGADGPLQKLRRWSRREPEIVARLSGLALVSLLTELNYRALSPSPDALAHRSVQMVLGLWAVLTLLFQQLQRRGWGSDPIRGFWIFGDMACLTLLLWIMEDLDTPLLIGYPLMIAASGLWFREGVVWFTTGLAVAGYVALYGHAAVDWGRAHAGWMKPGVLPYGNIFVACLLLTGFVVARLVKRIRVISRYYEVRRLG